MKKIAPPLGNLFLFLAALPVLLSGQADPAPSAAIWVSTPSGDKQLAREEVIPAQAAQDLNGDISIRLDTAQTFQTFDGMGSSLEPSTCYNLSQLPPQEREATLRALLSRESGIGMDLMRICIGTPDFTGDAWYSYCDLPPGETDTLLTQFSIAKDEAYILPVLREALRINPELRFFASPWSPPAWMKTSGSLTGGRLQPRYYASYARYLVRFIQAYEAAGVPVFALTVQNEPGVDREHDVPRWHYPSCHWTAEQQRDFIKNHLGPALERNGLETEIWCYDHNYNIEPLTDNSAVFVPERPGDAGIGFPRTILRDPAARAFTSAMAFHGYVGEPEGMSVIHEEFPAIPIRFTEGSVFGLSGGIELMRILKNWASSYNAWVTMLDQDRKPNNGPFAASRTLVERNTAQNKTVYTFDYYLYGHFMKFLTPGSTRIAAAGKDPDIHHLAAVNPKGQAVVILINDSDGEKPTQVVNGDRLIAFEIPAKSVVTVVW